jgi:hypothetical protein
MAEQGSEQVMLENQLRQRLAEADALVATYRKALRRDLTRWIVLSAMLGAAIGFTIAEALIDPINVYLPCEGISA